MGAVCIIIWVSICSIILFGSLKKLGWLRIDKEIEIVGLDISEMGGIDPHVMDKIRNHTFVSHA